MSFQTTRREFLKSSGLATAAAALGTPAAVGEATAPKPAQTAISRWRGFNLLNFFQALSRGERSDCTIRKNDLRWMRDWGFDFVRLPMDYWLWIDSDWRNTRKLDPDDMYRIRESTMEMVDRTVDLCRQYGMHLNLNFHRAPGYCINDAQREPFVLWQDERAQDAFVHHWELFAKRYRGVATSALSFNLVNEAPRPRNGYMTREDYCRIMTRATEAIRRQSPDRIVSIDGLSVGNEPVTELIPLGVVQSVHAYWPGQISHYRASWVDRSGTFPEPTWPILRRDGSTRIGRPQLESLYAPWADLARKGIGVHCGECGCYNKTPYAVFTAWFEDVMEILKGHGIGYSLWELRGTFGILDSGRNMIEQNKKFFDEQRATFEKLARDKQQD